MYPLVYYFGGELSIILSVFECFHLSIYIFNHPLSFWVQFGIFIPIQVSLGPICLPSSRTIRQSLKKSKKLENEVLLANGREKVVRERKKKLRRGKE